jgi:hypothetical protein
LTQVRGGTPRSASRRRAASSQHDSTYSRLRGRLGRVCVCVKKRDQEVSG